MQHRRIIKQGPVVLATREDGSMDPSSPSSQGLFLADTRFLSHFRITLNGSDLVLLGSSEEILFEAAFLHTNSADAGIPARGLGVLQRNTISDGEVHIDILLANWSLKPVSLTVGILVDSDFFDSFEARGMKRTRRGEVVPPHLVDGHVVLEYHGLDMVTRRTIIETSLPCEDFTENTMKFSLQLGVTERKPISLTVRMTETVSSQAKAEVEAERGHMIIPPWWDRAARVQTGNDLVDTIIQRSIDDLNVLMLEYPDAWVPAAGLPRFAVPFGRDCLVTGLQTLLWNPYLSRDVLRFLAHRQGKEVNPWNYEAPGKIMHEMHTGELARLKEVPFGLFYGSVDATPLFLVLGAEYLRWTGDLSLYHELRDNFEAAWSWIERYGDIDGSGYIQYSAHTPPAVSSAALSVGLFNQGWKDSATAVMYANGQMVTDHPIALAEVQGELYRARELWAQVFEAMPGDLRDPERAARLRKAAQDLKDRFNREFWMQDKGYFAMALDGHHRPVDSITSNPAECLWSRLIADEHLEPMLEILMGPSMRTAWGIRTMASTEKAYNPFSYHDGSIWPFENALIASGLKKYWRPAAAQQILADLMQASLYFEYRRWPEVYCGVSKDIGGVLARQPDASRPQAWSSGAIFMFLQTIMGISPRACSRVVDLTPSLPHGVNAVTIENICICGTTLSLRLVRDGDAVFTEVSDNPGDLDVVIHPAVCSTQNEPRTAAVPTASSD